jgi:hypothetical protein
VQDGRIEVDVVKNLLLPGDLDTLQYWIACPKAGVDEAGAW